MTHHTLNKTSVTSTEKKEKVTAFLKSWSTAVESAKNASEEQLNTSNVLQHYSEQGVLWGTISTKLRTTPTDIGHYFEHFCPKVTGETLWNIESVLSNGNIYIVGGSYTFQLSEPVSARFSFVLEEENSQLKIVHHHSSAVPENGLGLPS